MMRSYNLTQREMLVLRILIVTTLDSVLPLLLCLAKINKPAHLRTNFEFYLKINDGNHIYQVII